MIKGVLAILESLRLLNPFVTLGGGVFTFALALFNFFNAMWAQLIARLASVTMPADTGATVLSGFEFINYVFPLSELFTFCTAFMALYVICAAIRMVKAFIPTIS